MIREAQNFIAMTKLVMHDNIVYIYKLYERLKKVTQFNEILVYQIIREMTQLQSKIIWMQIWCNQWFGLLLIA